MSKSTILPLAASAAFLSACMPVSQSAPPVAPVAPVVQPVASVEGVAGLETREPDLCGAKNYKSALSQPGSIIPQLGVTKEYRVVEYRGIEPQDYDPNRIVFRLDAAGNVYNVDCG